MKLGTLAAELADVAVLQGLDWDVGAIGNAAWTGVRLSDVLKASCIYAAWERQSICVASMDLSCLLVLAADQ